MDIFLKNLLAKISKFEVTADAVYNLRVDGTLQGRNTNSAVDIVSKTDKSGIDIYVKAGTKGQRVDIPVLLTKSGLRDMVYNDFHIGEDCEVTIVAGCAICNNGDQNSQHDGIHTFYVGKNAKVKYVENHYAEGSKAKKFLMPTTVVYLQQGAFMQMDTWQIRGVDDTKRVTKAQLDDDSTLVINEKIFTNQDQHATTDFCVDLNGKNSSAHVVSRSVAQDGSCQQYISSINGNNVCTGHTECDAIVMDNAKVTAIPKINANCTDATLIHEAAIGKIAGEQLTKLMSLGLTQKQAEEFIIAGFIK